MSPEGQSGKSSLPEEPVLEGEILANDEPPRWQQGPRPHRPDIGAVINNALRAAGLIHD